MFQVTYIASSNSNYRLKRIDVFEDEIESIESLDAIL